jgi:WD40 repeat protein
VSKARWKLAGQFERHGRAVVIISLAMLCGCTTYLGGTIKINIGKAGAIRGNVNRGISLEDVDPEGRVLVMEEGVTPDQTSLMLWDPAKNAFGRRITPDWGLVPGKGWTPSMAPNPNSFKVVDNDGNIVGALGYYYLAVIDAERGILRKVLCSPDLKDPTSPYLDPERNAWSFVPAVTIARYQYTGLIAVAFNVGRWPRLFLLRRGWIAPFASWRMKRFVRDLAWSPDGKTMAVLYSGVFNNGLKDVVPLHRGEPESTLPDVALFDVKTGNSRRSFFSGDRQSSIIFSPDGNSIYCATWNQMEPSRGWVIRHFSTSDGKLLQEFKVRGMKLKGGLAVSPDGRFLVADANSIRWSLGVIKNDVYGYDRRFRFVVLDTATGKVAFEHQEKTHDTLLASPPNFVFSPDGKFLYVDPHLSGSGTPQINVYSLGTEHRVAPGGWLRH